MAAVENSSVFSWGRVAVVGIVGELVGAVGAHEIETASWEMGFSGGGGGLSTEFLFFTCKRLEMIL